MTRASLLAAARGLDGPRERMRRVWASLFASLQTRLTVLYAGLFGLALLVVAVAVYGAIDTTARRQVDNELIAGGAAFDRVWAVRQGQLSDNAAMLSRDFGFRETMATGDTATIASALDNLRLRLHLDVAFLVGVDGHITGPAGLDAAAATKLWQDLDAGADGGVLDIRGMPYQAVAAQVLAPEPRGWVVFAVRLDRRELATLEKLSSIPLNASVLSQGSHGWTGQGLSRADDARLSVLTTRALADKTPEPRQVATDAGAALALVKPLDSFGGELSAVLVLRYPLALALAPYRLLLVAVLLAGLLGLAAVIVGSWLLARSITRPVSALDAAAHRLERGQAAVVEVNTRDELGRLAQSFNAMASGIHERELRITRMALTDQETDLPNHRAFEDALDKAASRIVAVIGVERFSQVRAAIGYRLAATMIREIGERLAQSRPDAILARLSSERLGLLLDATSLAEAEVEAAVLLAQLERPLKLEGATIDAAFTIGLARLDAVEPLSAVERASIALDQARAAGRKTATFDAQAYGDPASKLSLMSEMRRALANGDISLHYQPKHNFRTGAIDSAEALIRWRHPERGVVSPDLFVSLAEETGHIRALTRWTLERIVADQHRLRAAGHDPLLAMNLSGRLLGEREFAEEAVSTVRAAGARLCFEITETAVIGNSDLAMASIERMRQAGIAISIDDYGSGLSSLAYLQAIPADELKIDKAFVLKLSESGRDALLVKSTVDLAHSLGLKVVAEGVETAETLSLLAGMGCDLAQGYFIARPMPLEDLIAFLDAGVQATSAPARDRRGPSAA